MQKDNWYKTKLDYYSNFFYDCEEKDHKEKLKFYFCAKIILRK